MKLSSTSRGSRHARHRCAELIRTLAVLVVPILIAHLTATYVAHAQSTDRCRSVLLCNQSFEVLSAATIGDIAANGGSIQTPAANVSCWNTTDAAGEIEIWRSGFKNITAFSGSYFAEINSSTGQSTLSQSFAVTAQTTIRVAFAHRGRYFGQDVMKVWIGPDNAESDNDPSTVFTPLGTPTDPSGLYSNNNSGGNNAPYVSGWLYHRTAPFTIPWPLPASANGRYRLKFESISTNGLIGPSTGGNLLDSVTVECDPCTELQLCNVGFDDVSDALRAEIGTEYAQTDAANVACWKTSASNQLIEIWRHMYGSVQAYSGQYFAELNATETATLSQDFYVSAATPVYVSFAHRGRYAQPDVMKVTVEGPTGVIQLVEMGSNLGVYSDDKDGGNVYPYSKGGWRYYTSDAITVQAGVNKLRFESISSNGGAGPVDGGNFLDSISVTCEPLVPCMVIQDARLLCLAMSQEDIGTYRLTMSVDALPAGTLSIVPITGTAGDVSGVTPSTIAAAFGGQVTATWANSANAPTGCFLVRITDRGRVVCEQRVCVDIPPCPSICGPCPFTYQVGPQTSTGSLWGLVIVNTPITGTSIPDVSATIISSSISQKCGTGPWMPIPVVGNSFVAGGLGGYVTSVGNTSEIGFTNLLCPSPGASPAGLVASILPDPSPRCAQIVKFCVRYELTDCECNKCDTVVCYTIERKWSRWMSTRSGEAITSARDQKFGGELQSGADANAVASIVMTSGTSGVLTIDNPAGDAETEALVLRTITVTPEVGVELLRMTPIGGTWTQGANTDSGMTSAGTLNAGDKLSFALEFGNETGKTVWRNRMHVAFNVPGLPASILVVTDVDLEARTPAARGGDTLVRDLSLGTARKDVRTYAMRFTNANRAGDSIATVAIRANAPASILAVGPGTDTAQAVLQSYRVPADGPQVLLTARELDDAAMSQIAPGVSSGPIYVTVSGSVDERTVFEYETRSRNGDVVSTGTVTINEPIGGVNRDGDAWAAVTTIGLDNAVPNPLTHSTMIRFELMEAEPFVSLVITDATGREVRTVIDGERLEAGTHSAVVDCSGLTSGSYFYTLRTNSQTLTRTMIVVH